jgi:LuxR family maltose regulon positive regulatory protein
LGAGGNLILAVAPAGFGKTTLISQWVEELQVTQKAEQRGDQTSNQVAAWLTLDEYDNDLPLFLRYLVAAIQTLYPNACENSLHLLQAPQLPPAHYLATTLLNELATLDAGVTLVLDDYHTIRAEAIHQFLTRVIEHLPHSIRLVLASRTDPPLPLARWRMQQPITELRAADLAFSAAETQLFLTQLFLTQALGKTPTLELLHTLDEQVEGWAAGLQLVALSLRTQPDERALAHALASNNRYVMDYLLDEVFQRQSPAVQNFLLRTCLLDRFCAPLAAALSAKSDPTRRLPGGEQAAQADSQAILADLVAANLFIVSLDDQGKWYRYHHLFGELLRHHLQTRADAASIALLHQQASAWLAGHGLIEEAIQHALAGGDAQQAALLVGQHRHALLNREEWRTLDRWLARLPESLVQQQPTLLLAKAWVLQFQFRMAAIPPLLQAATLRLRDLANDPALAEALQGEMEALSGLVWYWQNEGERSLAAMQQSLAHLPPTWVYARGGTLFYLGMAAQMTGQSAMAMEVLRTALEAEPSRPTPFNTRVFLGLSFIHYLDGNLTLMHQAAQDLLALATQAHLTLLVGWAHYLLGLVYWEWNALADAAHHFAAAVALRYQLHALAVHNSWLGLAWVQQAQGESAAARQQSAALRQFHHEQSNLALLPATHAFQSRLALQQGDQAAAARWAQAVNLEPVRGPLVQFELPQLTYSKICLAQGGAVRVTAALHALAELRQVAEHTHNTPRQVELLALQALAEAQQGEPELALTTLHRAVVLAKPGHFVRTFVDLGPQLAVLLEQLAARGVETEYLVQVIAALSTTKTTRQPGQPSQPERQAHLLEALTERELEVLALLARRFSNQEIGQALFISPLTVRTHASNLYQKLGANTRKAAVARARELGLLPAEQ